MDYNFIRSATEAADLDLFFGPICQDDTVIKIEPGMIMADIMAIVGLFPSKSQARKNGWNKAIPRGFSDMRVGKSKVRVTIFDEIQSGEGETHGLS